MQQISNALSAHLQQQVTSLATCWKVTRRDETMLGFTDYDRDIEFENITYKASAGMSSTAVTSSLGMRVDNLEIEGILNDEIISENDILAGLYDFAQIDVFSVNHQDLSAGSLHIKTGWFGEVTMRSGQFVAEVRGLSSHLQTTMGEVYTPTCRAQFGDSRCGFDLSTVTVAGTVTSFENTLRITDTTRTEADGFFDYGIITFNTGLNAGLSREVQRYQLQTFTVNEPLPYAIANGDSYTAIAGCDKRLDTCVNRYNNALNFRGEPHVPGTDRLLTTAATR